MLVVTLYRLASYIAMRQGFCMIVLHCCGFYVHCVVCHPLKKLTSGQDMQIFKLLPCLIQVRDVDTFQCSNNVHACTFIC